MGAKKNVTVEGAIDEVKIVKTQEGGIVDPQVNDKIAVELAEEEKAKKKVKIARGRSPKYVKARSLVDKSKFFSPTEAIELVKKTSYSSFPGTISADLVLKEVDNQIAVTLPHQTGKVLRVAIVDDDLIKAIEGGNLDFDVLLTTPAYMPKLAKLARVLGPKGLMPNPKNQTIVSDPEKRKAELLGGKTILKTERKMPLLHVTLGKTDLDTQKLVENLEAIMKVTADKTVKIAISATMSPSVKVALNK